ncbi:MAG: carbohydrate-binding family 9-like protein [Phycisphaeraceae bacterium]|nr:MAG: carbohydrate-binding family 9-like protein [Phycisphaeraceae bacterium]
MTRTPPIPRVYRCVRTPEPPGLTAPGDAFPWSLAPWSEPFVDISDDHGRPSPPPPLDTRFKMLWDDRALHVLVWMDEPHVRATLTERDSVIYADNDIELFLDPTGAGRRYYEIEVNALGTVFDLALDRPYHEGGRADHTFDVRGLRACVRVDGTLNDPRDTDRGWAAGLAVPWAALDRHGQSPGRPPAPGERWRVNVSRVQWDHRIVHGRYETVPGRPEHNWVWSPTGRIDMHRPERWGVVTFEPAPGP